MSRWLPLVLVAILLLTACTPAPEPAGPAAPEPAAPAAPAGPAGPEPAGPEPAAPEPGGPEPAAPEPGGPEPAAPEPGGPDPGAPAAEAGPEPVAPGPDGSVTLRYDRSECGAPPAPQTVPRSRQVFRWRPGGEAEAVGRVPAPLEPLPFSAPAAVHGGRTVLYHQTGDDGNAYCYGGWLTDLGGGTLALLFPPRAHATGLEARWLPGGAGLVLEAIGRVDFHGPGGDLRRSVQPGGAEVGPLLGVAVEPGTGRVAVFRGISDPANRGVVDLFILSPAGDELHHVPGVSLLTHSESFWRTISAAWLPDGRLAYTRWVELQPLPVLAVADPAAGAVTDTGITAGEVAGVLAGGQVVLQGEGGWGVQAPDGGGFIAFPEGAGWQGLVSVDPAGERVAFAVGEGQVGVWTAATDRWEPLGPGQLLGWDEAGAVYWLALAP